MAPGKLLMSHSQFHRLEASTEACTTEDRRAQNWKPAAVRKASIPIHTLDCQNAFLASGRPPPLQGLMPPYGPLYGETANGSLNRRSCMPPCGPSDVARDLEDGGFPPRPGTRSPTAGLSLGPHHGESRGLSLNPKSFCVGWQKGGGIRHGRPRVALREPPITSFREGGSVATREAKGNPKP